MRQLLSWMGPLGVLSSGSLAIGAWFSACDEMEDFAICSAAAPAAIAKAASSTRQTKRRRMIHLSRVQQKVIFCTGSSSARGPRQARSRLAGVEAQTAMITAVLYPPGHASLQRHGQPHCGE